MSFVISFVFGIIVGIVVGQKILDKLKRIGFLSKWLINHKQEDLSSHTPEATPETDSSHDIDAGSINEENQEETIQSKSQSDQCKYTESPKGSTKSKENDDFIDPTNGFVSISPYWIAVGSSVIGSSHLSSDMPCQDNNGFIDLANGWGIAVVSDGAGSARFSHTGSKIAVKCAIDQFKKAIIDRKWIEKATLPTDEEWQEVSFLMLKNIKDALSYFATKKQINITDLNATIIVIIHSPNGLLACHIGDGRAGYKNSQGEWRPLITPHKGDEANQTIFLPSDYWEKPYARLSGVRVPEAIVIRDTVQAYALMSDGCESTAWEFNLFNPEKKCFYDPNKPYSRFFNPCVEQVLNLCSEHIAPYIIKREWTKFLKEGNDTLRNEPDDKTLILVAANNL